MCHGQGCRVFFGDGNNPTLNSWVDEFIPYYMEIMGF